ncbi:hypothetical protein BST42_04250 [Mycolicibacterium rhodesiae]|uniref:Alanine and proline rich membrane protein n=1 Tax=Mycolicibacterium rhodesiae TaxID=36814 RepID=A0A1X0J360_MYCRH|nr:hypothetical protein BST42_04250 [Mycolicibacterium rhodesiae]
MIAIVIAVIAVVVAIGAWFRPAPKPETPAAKTYSEQEVASAKKAVCDAYNLVHNAIVVTNNKNGGSDPTAILAVASNGRLAVHAGGQYLSDALNRHPATPNDLAQSITDLATTFQKLTLEYLAETPDSEQEPLLRSADDATARIKQNCT